MDKHEILLAAIFSGVAMLVIILLRIAQLREEGKTVYRRGLKRKKHKDFNKS
jgi:hypothetical protein